MIELLVSIYCRGIVESKIVFLCVRFRYVQNLSLLNVDDWRIQKRQRSMFESHSMKFSESGGLKSVFSRYLKNYPFDFRFLGRFGFLVKNAVDQTSSQSGPRNGKKVTLLSFFFNSKGCSFARGRNVNSLSCRGIKELSKTTKISSKLYYINRTMSV